MRKRTLSLILSIFIALQGALLCACRRDDTGYFVTFGQYGGAPIKWIILDINSDTYLLVSEYILDAMPFDLTASTTGWENSSLRKWLNEEFYEQAFTPQEKARILTITPTNRRPQPEAQPDSEVRDKVFLLSSHEVNAFFKTDDARVGKPTALAKERYSASSDSSTWKWWLFSEADDGNSVLVDEEGKVSVSSSINTSESYGVRPAMVITSERYEYIKESEAKKESSKNQTVPTTTHPRETALEGIETVQFGSQQGQDIEWIVLDKKDGYTLLLAKCVICAKQYSLEDYPAAWENCLLNSWLNDTYVNQIFNSNERSHLVSPSEVGSTGKDTTSKVFLLSREEMEMYFPDPYGRVCKFADYTDRKGLYESTDGYCVYWLRSDQQDDTCFVSEKGEISDEFQYYDWVGVRPAIWVKI